MLRRLEELTQVRGSVPGQGAQPADSSPAKLDRGKTSALKAGHARRLPDSIEIGTMVSLRHYGFG
jgi:hypothetical protein